MGEATALVVEPIRVEPLADLSFGCIAVAGSGTVAIDARSGAARPFGGIRLLEGAPGCASHPALFAISGEATRSYRFTVDPDVIAVHVAQPEVTLAVRGLHGVGGNPAEGEGIGTLDGAGRDRLRVGGTLLVPAGTRAGHYKARVKVTVAYE